MDDGSSMTLAPAPETWRVKNRFEVGADGAIRHINQGKVRYSRFGANKSAHRVGFGGWAPNQGPTESESDRNAILDSVAFRRLMGVTQIVSPDPDSPYLNTRYSHSLKVAQLARHISERLIRNADIDGSPTSPDAVKRSARDCLKRFGGLDSVACEAAGLAHDLGHPPFGHIGERVINQCLQSRGVHDGFEGNAQTFRILTVLEGERPEGTRSSNIDTGLGLSALVRCAVLKYPWTRDDAPSTRKDRWAKYCVYSTEKKVFANARTKMGFKATDQTQSLEASIMDLADDVAYSFHDLEDFTRVGVLNGYAVVRALEEWKEYCDANSGILADDVNHCREWITIISTSDSPKEREKAQNHLDDLLHRDYSNPFWGAVFNLARVPYFNTRDWHEATRIVLDQMNTLVKTQSVFDLRFVLSEWQEQVLDKVVYQKDGVWLGGPCVSLEKHYWHQVEMYKVVTQRFVHVSPRVTLIQRAQRQSIRSLFDGLVEWCNEGVRTDELPPRLRDMLTCEGIEPYTTTGLPVVGSLDPEPLEPSTEQYRTLRCISDYICSLTDYECQQRSSWLRGLEIPGISHMLP